MEEKISQPAPETPSEKSKTEVSSENYAKIFIIGFICFLVVLGISFAAYMFGTKNPSTFQQTPNIIPVVENLNQITITPTLSMPCNLQNAENCKTVDGIKTAIENKKYSDLLPYYELNTVDCPEPGGYPIQVCEGKTQGTKVSGYNVGYNYSEGGLLSKDYFLTTINDYVNQSGPFVFKSYNETSNIIHYLSADERSMFDVHFKNTTDGLKIDYLLLGISNEYMQKQTTPQPTQ